MIKAIQLAECAEETASAFDGVVVDGGRLHWAIAAELRRLERVERAATALIKCKGRYHAEQNTNALAKALDITLPYYFPDAEKMVSGNQVDDINVVDLEQPLQVKMADILAVQLDEAKRGDPYNHGLYNGMLYMVAAHDGGEYKPIGKEDFYTNGTGNPFLEQVILNVIRDGTAGMLVSAEGIKALSAEDMYIRPSAIELQAAEIGIPEPVTELINPVPTVPLNRIEALLQLVGGVKVWPETCCSYIAPNGWEWIKSMSNEVSLCKIGEVGIFKEDWLIMTQALGHFPQPLGSYFTNERLDWK